MTDIASLSFAIDSSDARRAKTDLDAMRGSSSDASEQAVRLTRAFVDGKDPLAVYRAELALMDQQMRQAGQGIDGLIDRMNRLSVSTSSLQQPMRELRQVVGQIDAAAAAFGTTSAGMETFVRTSRSVGLSSGEMTTALGRIQEALRGVSEEGQRARQALSNYGVSLEGRNPQDAAAVLREVTERMRLYRMDPGTGEDMRSALGGLSISTLAAIRDPDFRGTAQRERELRADAEAGRISDLRRMNVGLSAGVTRRQQEFADLEAEYGASVSDMGSWGGLSFLPSGSTGQRRGELERRRDSGAVGVTERNRRWDESTRAGLRLALGYSADDAAPNQGAFDGIGPLMRAGGAGAVAWNVLQNPSRAISRGYGWLTSDEYAANGQNIDLWEQYERTDPRYSATFTQQALRYARGAANPLQGIANMILPEDRAGERAWSRRLANAFGVDTPRGLPDTGMVQERVEGFEASTARAMFQGGFSEAEQARQRRYVGYAGEFQAQIPNAGGLTADQIAERLTPAQRAAAEQREGAFFGIALQGRARQMAYASRQDMLATDGVDVATGDMYGIGSTGGAGAYEQEAERSRRVAAAIVAAEKEITNAYQLGARIRLEVAEIERQIEQQRTEATARTNRRTEDLTEQARIIERTINVSGAEGTAAALRQRMAERQSQQSGGASTESILSGEFAQEVVGAQRQYLQGRRQGEAQSYRLGRLREGASETSIADSERVYEITRGMREANEALRGVVGEQNEKYRANRDTIIEIEAKLRAQLEIQREITRETNMELLARQTAQTTLTTGVAGQDTTAGGRRRRETLEARAQAVMGEGTTLEQARERLNSDAGFRQGIEAWADAQMNAGNEAGRFNHAARMRAAAAGGTGDPRRDEMQRRQARRVQIMDDYAENPDMIRRELEAAQAEWARSDASLSRAPIVRAQQATEQEQARTRAQVGISYTQRDLENFARTIATEEGTAEGRRAVGSVILNRARTSGQGLSDVVLAPAQFDVWRRGMAQNVDLSSPRGREAMQIAERLLSGELTDPTGGAQHFHAASMAQRPGWAAGREAQRIGDTLFYRGVGVSGQASSYRAAYGVEGELAASATGYRQGGGTEVALYTETQAREMAVRSLGEFSRQLAQASIALGEMEDQIGATPYERGLAAADARAAPAAARDRSIAASLPEGDPERLRLEQQADERFALERRRYQTGLRAQRVDERQAMDDQEGDLRFRSGYIFSSSRMERDLGVRQERRRLDRTYGVRPENEADAQRVGVIHELREQERVMGMLRDSWYQIGNSASQALERIILQGGKATDVIKALLAEMASYYIRAGSRLLMQGVGNIAQDGLSALMGGGGNIAPVAAGAMDLGTKAASAVSFTALPAAQGAVLDRNFATPMAQGGGGIFSHAQYVPMANGGTALVAEAGPEAAVPLVRMPSGNLGVRTQGGGGGGPAIANNFNVTVNGGGGGGGGQGGGERMGTDIARALQGMVTEVIGRQMSPGGVLHDGPVMR